MSKGNSNGIIVLDTHVWIWLINGDPRLSASNILQTIEEAAQASNIKVSVISAWEIGMLESKKRLSFSEDCLDWVKHALSAPGISLASLTPEIAVLSTRLPGDFHGDPADRIIAATAISLNATLLTADKKILKYSESAPLETIAL